MRKQIEVAVFFLLLPKVFGQIDYQTQVQPLFNDKCVSCHGGASGVTLSSYSTTMSSIGSQYGKAIVAPGDTAGSPLWDKITPNPQHGNRMPAIGSLSAVQISTIGQWIVEGAHETTSVVGTEKANPAGFELYANYPNPFNPSTRIRFNLSRPSTINLAVKDVNGRLVRTLHGHYPGGTHEVTVELSDQPSGMYLARLAAVSEGGAFESRTLKMMLLK
ncbi:MAG: T9SS type A sorting domain-containing protein [Syntrophaceae bacterium]|nr:T9SS type A sorting domain-containing protein [Syntrophaceae bacterium]